MATLVPVDHDPFADDVVLPPANPAAPPEAVSRWVQDTARRLATIPQRAFQASESLRTGGDYDPAPVVDAAQLAMTGGVPFAARGALGIFGGKLAAQNLAAKGIDQPSLALKMAEHMDAQGLPKEDIYSVTSKMLEGTPYAGVSKGAEGKWRFEIPDKHDLLDAPNGGIVETGARMKVGPESFAGPLASGYTPLATVRQMMQHEDLYAAYPDLKPIAVRSQDEAGATYFPGSRLRPENISLNRGDLSRLGAPTRTQDISRPTSNMLHELQHAVQEREGFAEGTSPDAIYLDPRIPKFKFGEQLATSRGADWTDMSKAERREIINEIMTAAYGRHAGEVEARNVQRRMNMTPAERRASPPWTTEDVPRDQQIVRGVQLIPVDHTPDFE